MPHNLPYFMLLFSIDCDNGTEYHVKQGLYIRIVCQCRTNILVRSKSGSFWRPLPVSNLLLHGVYDCSFCSIASCFILFCPILYA